MSTSPTPPPAGWYPAPNGSSEKWWWDGVRWTQPAPQPTFQPAVPRGVGKLALAVQVLLILCAAASVVSIGVETFGIDALADYENGQYAAYERITTYDTINLFTILATSSLLIATGVVWMVWQYKAARHVLGRTRRSPGWHVASWMIPIVTLWFPYQNIADLWRASGRARPWWQIVWWVLWLASSAFTQVSNIISNTAVEIAQFRDSLTASLVSEALLLAAAPLAYLTIRGITQGLMRGDVLPGLPTLTQAYGGSGRL
jgi:hypothetical protein